MRRKILFFFAFMVVGLFGPITKNTFISKFLNSLNKKWFEVTLNKIRYANTVVLNHISNFSNKGKNLLYNFREYIHVTIMIETYNILLIKKLVKAHSIIITESQKIKNTRKLTETILAVSNQTLKFYDQIGKLIKTINNKISIYSNEDMSMLATDMYYIVFPQTHMKPLKFVIAH